MADPPGTVNEVFTPEENLEAQVARLSHELEQALRERDEARAWARGYESGMFLFDTTDPPEWLVDRFDEDGNPLDENGHAVPGDPRLF